MLALIVMCMLAAAEEPKDKAGAGRLPEVIITAPEKAKLTSKKPRLHLKVDIREVVLPTILVEPPLLRQQPPRRARVRPGVPRMASPAVSAPWLTVVRTTPVAVFTPQLPHQTIERWELIIMDDRGHRVRLFTGQTQTLNKPVAWDGRSDDGKVLKVGRPYSYLFRYYDKGGNLHTEVGEPFIVKAVAHQEPHGIVVSLALPALFSAASTVSPARGSSVTTQGKRLLREVADWLKGFSGVPFIVKVHAAGVVDATRRARDIGRLLAKRLFIRDKRITIQGVQANPGYERVEVIIPTGQ